MTVLKTVLKKIFYDKVENHFSDDENEQKNYHDAS